MKICLFADAQSIHIQQLAPGLAELGHDIHVVTHKPAPVAGATVERFRVPEPGITNLRRWRGRLSEYLRGFLRRFDVVNIHFLQDWGFRFDPPIVENAALIATAWGSDIFDPPGETAASGELINLRRTLLRRADAVTACGPSFAGEVAAYAGVTVNRVEVLPFGVNLEIFANPPRTTWSRGTFRVGFFKGFRPVYGPTVLMEAIPLILRRLPDVRFELVGDGAELHKCQMMAVELGVQSAIEWLPRQPHERLPDLLARWDLSVMPSIHEAFGVAALESSAMEVPVAASNVCGLRDTVRHGETGLLVQPRNPGALADAVIELLRDDELRGRMARAGREMVEREYNWRDLYIRWANFFERVREGIAVVV